MIRDNEERGREGRKFQFAGLETSNHLTPNHGDSKFLFLHEKGYHGGEMWRMPLMSRGLAAVVC